MCIRDSSNSGLQDLIVEQSKDDILLSKNQYDEYKEHSDGYFKKLNNNEIYIRLESNVMDQIKIEDLSVRPVVYDGDNNIIKEAIPNENKVIIKKVIPNHKPPPPPIPKFVPGKLYKDHNNDIVTYKNEIRNTEGKVQKYKFNNPNHTFTTIILIFCLIIEESNYVPYSLDFLIPSRNVISFRNRDRKRFNESHWRHNTIYCMYSMLCYLLINFIFLYQ